ncbi:MAG: hypothetical protein K0R98_198 [Rickettsiaceae bacterium]|jgi:RHH-type rel operon transcriptional repressor/antitoxin RelB|nr:hypothetical protein [Rickettsiaceae bacterium]
MTTPISIRLDDNLDARLSAIAEITGRSKSHLIRQLIDDHIEVMEDLYISLRRLEKGEDRYSLDSVKQELLSDD